MFERELRSIGLKTSFRNALAPIMAVSFIACLFELSFLSLPSGYIVVFATAFLPSTLFYFFLDYLRAKRIREIEHQLPNALYQIASFPKGTPMEEIIKSVAESDFGPLSWEFKRAEMEVMAGASVTEAFEKTWERNPSPLLRRTLSLLCESYRNGADLELVFKELADDAFELQSISAETAAALSLQKYTLLVGGCIIVPFILALLLSIVSSLDLNFGELPSPAGSRSHLVEAIVFSTQIYLMIFSFLASYFVSLIEANRKKTVLYFAVLFPLSLIVFNLVKAASFI